MKKSVAGVLIVFLLMPIGGMVGCAPRVGGPIMPARKRDRRSP